MLLDTQSASDCYRISILGSLLTEGMILFS